MKRLLIILWLLLAAVGNASFAGQIIYVDANATGANNGSSWSDAYKYLQDALADVNSSPKPVEIRVAQGIYRPDETSAEPNGTGDREATFQLINGVTLKGGYAGLGQPDPNARDIDKYKTILSGDLNGNDVEVIAPWDLKDEPTRQENSYNVVRAIGTDDTAVLDAFVVTAGNANWTEGGPLVHRSCGGGMYIESANPTIINCRFTENYASWNGGGVYNGYGSNSIFTCCIFTRNYGKFGGGGMVNLFSNSTLVNCTFGGAQSLEGNYTVGGGGGMNNSRSNPILTNCTFRGNFGGGGAIANYQSSPVLISCTLIDNKAKIGNIEVYGDGGAIYGGSGEIRNCTIAFNKAHYGGALYNCSASLTNCLIVGNLAWGYGGGIYCWSYKQENVSTPILTNCTIAENLAPNGRAIACYSPPDKKYPSTVVLKNCILWDGGNEIWNNNGSTISITYSDVQDGWPGQGNINADPCFADPGHWEDPCNTPDKFWDDIFVNRNCDYHLKSQAGRWNPATKAWIKDKVTSPCIDSGATASPIGLEPFPNGGIINMGAYGGTAEASKSYFGEPACETIVAGDINGDCIVNLKDFAFMAFHWLEEK